MGTLDTILIIGGVIVAGYMLYNYVQSTCMLCMPPNVKFDSDAGCECRSPETMKKMGIKL